MDVVDICAMVANAFTNTCIAIAAVSMPTPTSTIDPLNANKVVSTFARLNRAAIVANNISAPPTTTAPLPIVSNPILENIWKDVANINNDPANNITPPEIPAISVKISVPDFPIAVSPASIPNTDSNTAANPNVAVKMLCHGTVARIVIDIPKATNNKATPESCIRTFLRSLNSIVFIRLNNCATTTKNPVTNAAYIEPAL